MHTPRFFGAVGIVSLFALILPGCGGKSGRSGGSDQTPPTVTIQTPTTADTYATNVTPLAIAGTASDDLLLTSVTWSNAATTDSGTAAGTDSWSILVPLADGSNLITVTATDTVANTGTDSITVTLDATPPVVTIDTPTTAPATVVFATPITLGGTASDNDAVALVTWSNATTSDSGTATGTTTWTTSIPLAMGMNNITVTAEDNLGNTSTDGITVTRMLGEAFAWGGNASGQIGDGTPPIFTSPVQVIDPNDPTNYLTGVTAIGGGGLHTLALIGDTTVRAWGNGGSGEIGDGMFENRASPVQVVDPSDPTGFLTNVTSVGTGWAHSLALLGDGTVRGWGGNWEAQLGDGTRSVRSTPIQTTDPTDPTGFLTNVAEINPGYYYSVARLVDGTVRAWGDNLYGQLGDGTTTDALEPVQVVDLSDPTGFLTTVAAVAAGRSHTVALLADGTVRTWGANGSGQLGDGSTLASLTPVQVIDPSDPTGFLTNVAAIAAGEYHTVAILLDGTLRTWGNGEYGKLGDGSSVARNTPVQVSDPPDPTGYLTNVVAISAGEGHTAAVIAGGTVRTWGWNAFGQLGDGTTTDSLLPTQVIDPTDPSGFLTGVSDVLARRDHCITLQVDGTVRAWGHKGYGVLGEGSPGIVDVATQVKDPSDPTGNLTRVAAAAGGFNHSTVLLTDGTVRSWGENPYGQLGDGSTNISWTPVQVIDPSDPTGTLTGVQGIAAGWYHSAALMTDGTVRSWGRGWFGAMGDGASTDRLTPVQVQDPADPSGFLTGVIAIDAGGYRTVALKPDGTLWTWGRNLSGELGDGTKTNRLTVIQVTDPTDPSGFLTGVAAVSAGDFYTVALLDDGTLKAWGQNFYGQLGDGSVVESLVPIPVVDPPDPSGLLQNVAAVAGGYDHTVALLLDGTVRAWGDNPGALGDGTTMDTTTPVQVVDPSDPSGFLTGVVSVASAWTTSAMLMGDGTVRACGMNIYGQVGNGTTSLESIPVQVQHPLDPTGFLTEVTAIAMGYNHVIALK